MFWDMGFSSDPLMDLLQQEGIQLRQILEEGTMLQEFRTGHQELTEYFTREDVITELCEWSMTLKHGNEEQFEHLSRLSTEVLVCGGSMYSDTLIHSQSFKTFCDTFLSNENEWDSLCVGHFQKVFIHLLRHSNGHYLRSFPSIIDSLTSHLSLMSAVELVVILETEFSDFLPGDFVPLIASYVDTSLCSAFPAAYALRRIISLGWDNSSVRASFSSEPVVTRLVHAALSSREFLLSAELLRLLWDLQRKSAAAKEIVQRHASEFYTGDTANTALRALSAANISRSSADAARMISCGRLHWAIANKLLAQLECLSKDELVAVVEETGAVAKICECIEQERMSAQQLRLVEMINEADSRLTAALPEEVVKKAMMLGKKYGGEIPIGFQDEAKLNAE